MSIERRPLIADTDTLFLQLSRATQRSYRFKFIPSDIDPNLTAFLEDNFTGIQTPLSVTAASVHDFVITSDAKSGLANRFKIIFKQLPPPPVTFKTITASQKNTRIAVEWVIENERNITGYEVEKSADGINFIKVNTTSATGANQPATSYNWLDVNPLSGNNFYRVRFTNAGGGFTYSNTVLVNMGKLFSGIRIYPNPVTNGTIGVEFKNQPSGIFKARLLNSNGQTIFTKTINHSWGNAMENIKPGYKLTAGIYQLEITAPDNGITTVKVIVQ